MLTVNADRDVVERQLAGGELACLSCGGATMPTPGTMAAAAAEVRVSRATIDRWIRVL